MKCNINYVSTKDMDNIMQRCNNINDKKCTAKYQDMEVRKCKNLVKENKIKDKEQEEEVIELNTEIKKLNRFISHL